jgi:hypothetical protein
MPSIYRQDSRSDPHDASMQNFAKARAKWRPPRPWRSDEEAQLIKRFVFQWLTSRDRSRPTGRAWARQLGISHTWLQKLARRFQSDPDGARRMNARCGDPTFVQLSRAREETQRMREGGLLRRAARREVF